MSTAKGNTGTTDLHSCCRMCVAMNFSSALAFCVNIRLCQLQCSGNHGLRKDLIEYLHSQGTAELFSVLSAVISVNMLKGCYKASSGIPQVENTKFFLSGYKYFLCVDCPLYKGCNLCFMVFFTSFCCFAVSVCLSLLFWRPLSQPPKSTYFITKTILSQTPKQKL